jgi:hypothetical protein
VVDAVNDDQRAGRAAGAVGVEGGLLGQHDAAEPDLVQLQFLGFVLAQIVDVHAVVDGLDRAAEIAVRELELVLAARQQRRVAHPDDVRVEDPAHRGRAVRVHEEVAAADVDLVLERDGHGHVRAGSAELFVEGHDLATLLMRRDGTAMIESPTATLPRRSSRRSRGTCGRAGSRTEPAAAGRRAPRRG